MRPIRSAKILVAVGAVILTILADSGPFKEAPNVGIHLWSPAGGTESSPGRHFWGTRPIPPAFATTQTPCRKLDLSRKLPQNLFRGNQVFLRIDADSIEGSMHHVNTDPFFEQS